MCDHKNIVLLADGWYCPDCGEHFDEKPKKPKAEKPKEPKVEPKKANKSTSKK